MNINNIKHVFFITTYLLLSHLTCVWYGQLYQPLPTPIQIDKTSPQASMLDLGPLDDVGYFEKKKTKLTP